MFFRGKSCVTIIFLLQSEDFFGIVSNDHIARQQRENIEYIVKMKRQMSSRCTNKTSYEKRLIGQNVLRKTSYWTKRPTDEKPSDIHAVHKILRK